MAAPAAARSLSAQIRRIRNPVFIDIGIENDQIYLPKKSCLW